MHNAAAAAAAATRISDKFSIALAHSEMKQIASLILGKHCFQWFGLHATYAYILFDTQRTLSLGKVNRSMAERFYL